MSEEKNQELVGQALQTCMFTNEDVRGRLRWFEKKVESIEAQFKEVGGAKQAIAEIVSGGAGGDAEDPNDVAGLLDGIKNEIAALKEVYKVLSVRWDSLKELGKETFMAVDTRNLSKELRLMEEDLARLPSKYKQYQVFDKFLAIVGQKKKMAKSILSAMNAGGTVHCTHIALCFMFGIRNDCCWLEVCSCCAHGVTCLLSKSF